MEPLVTISLEEYNTLKENNDKFLQYTRNNTTTVIIYSRYGEDKTDIITTNEEFIKKINALSNFYNSEIVKLNKEQDLLLEECEQFKSEKDYYFKLHIETKDKLEQLKKVPEKIKKKYGLCV